MSPLRQRSSSRDKVQERILIAFCLHQEGIQCFERGNVNGARDCFHSSFALITRLLRETRNRDAFYFRGSPVSRESSLSPCFQDSATRPSSATHPCSFRKDNGNDGSSSSSSSPLEETTTNKMLSSPASENATNARVTRMISLHAPCSKQEQQHVGEEDDTAEFQPPIYTRLLSLPPKVTVKQFVFCTLYNLALSTQVSALSLVGEEQQQEEERASRIRQCVQQWDLLYPLQWKQGLNLRPLHGLAILHNLGHAKRLAGDSRASKICFRNVISALSILETRRQEVPERSFFMYQAICNLNRQELMEQSQQCPQRASGAVLSLTTASAA